jgi:succinate dehydrogenase/fumarate reductase cytochrome b subunit
MNGIRLILAELGIGIRKPSAIEYPYEPKSLRSFQRYLVWAAIAVAIAAAACAWLILFG